MEVMRSLDDCKAKLWSDYLSLANALTQAAGKTALSLEEAIPALASLREGIYESLNQTLHEYYAVRGLEWLLSARPEFQALEWHWNPRATGTSLEPDIRGVAGTQVIVSAEVTTSPRPSGVIDSRMRATLIKLSQMAGAKYYFVTSPQMAQRANTKLAKAKYRIEVVDLSTFKQIL
ncbi:hypothetical protein [Rhizobium mesosinicum]|uniref:Restriction endonuclease type IV Mrr domain-containing protein n=1 Tax=Rhizobium mesosinicum TaxID=335017 RepID=A0ABS7GRF4_9HYPH|nr:hypothetical protein [Rhizobium mesosinicum]MBW9052261.1 hypothetical protein [Rhizobium mesosinicum]